jgi:hypothetical protein
MYIVLSKSEMSNDKMSKFKFKTSLLCYRLTSAGGCQKGSDKFAIFGIVSSFYYMYVIHR